MRVFESALLAAALALTGPRPMRRAVQRHGVVEPCPQELEGRLAMTASRSAMVLSLWNDSGLCRLRSAFGGGESPRREEAGALALFARLEAEGYTFAREPALSEAQVRITRLKPLRASFLPATHAA